MSTPGFATAAADAKGTLPYNCCTMYLVRRDDTIATIECLVQALQQKSPLVKQNGRVLVVLCLSITIVVVLQSLTARVRLHQKLSQKDQRHRAQALRVARLRLFLVLPSPPLHNAARRNASPPAVFVFSTPRPDRVVCARSNDDHPSFTRFDSSRLDHTHRRTQGPRSTFNYGGDRDKKRREKSRRAKHDAQ